LKSNAMKHSPKRKSPFMLLMTLALWLVSLWVFGKSLIQPFAQVNNAFQAAVLALYTLMIAFFWFLSAYYISVLAAYFLFRTCKPERALVRGRVAVMYTVCNDFKLAAAETCANQDYDDFHMFVLDDSTSEEERGKVDAFQSLHPERVTVIRRGDRAGFKAGNMNNALRQLKDEYEFFVPADADEMLPRDFISRMLPCLCHEDIAFAQAAHMPNQQGLTRFSYDVSPTICPFWMLHIVPRNRCGAVVFMGHGAILRTSAWQAAGGFPEVTSEDFAFTIKLLEQGLKGVYCSDVMCHEDFPSDYAGFRAQQKRYVAGSVQALGICIPPLLHSKKASMIEKADLMLWSIPLYVPALALMYLVLTSVLLPLAFGGLHAPTLVLFGHELTLFPMYVVQDVFSSMSGLSYRVFSAVCALSPLFATVTAGLLGFIPKKRALRLMLYSTAAYMSLMLSAWKGILGYAKRKRVQWQPSGAKAAKSAAFPVGELVVGAVLCLCSAFTMNLSGVAVSLSLIAGALALKWGWDSKKVRAISILCFGLLMLHILLSLLLNANPMANAVPMIFSVHF